MAILTQKGGFLPFESLWPSGGGWRFGHHPSGVGNNAIDIARRRFIVGQNQAARSRGEDSATNFDFMTLDSLSKLSKKLKIVAGIVQILMGLLCVFFGIYRFDEHMKVDFICVMLWLVGLFSCLGGINMIFAARRKT
jgi:hypothetical protein